MLLFVIATSGYGDEAAREAVNNERGFVPEKLYQFGGIDSVNLFNGNLTLSIPIGGSAPVSSNLSYGLTLYYNSKLWNAESLMTGNQCGDGAQQDAGNVAFPVASRMNAGLGWSFGFGWVTPEGAYNTPDGAYHPFGVGHPYNPPVNDIVKVWYSSDGSNLRMMKTTAGKFRVEFPDGSFHTFGADGSIESMNDRFGNSVVITSVKLATIWTWTATDAHRTQTIRLKKAAPSSEDPGTQARRFPVFEWVVDEVELTAFSAPGTSTTAIYKFEYDDADIRRGCANAYRDPCTTNVRIPLLAALILPDGSRYAFAYNRPSDTCFATGTLMKMTLPTGGGLGWDYVDYTLPSNGCATVASGLQWKNYTLGVKTKTLYGPGDTAQGKWEYWQHLAEADPIPNICPPQSLPNGNFEYDATHYGAEHSITAVTDPEGRTAWHYFATWNSDINPGYENANQAHEYGLPFTRAISIDADGDPARPRFLSREICESGTGHDEAHPCVPLRKMYLRYNETSPLDLYPRRSVIAEHTQFIEDPGAPEPLGGLPYIDSESSDYDGHGNHRTAVVRSSFGPTRTTFTDYNPGSDEHGKEGDAPYLGPGEPWVLHRYTTEKVTETEVTGTGTRTFESTAKACFDPFGQLLGKRWLAGATEDEKDVVVRYGYVTGERVSEDWYGGDRPQFAVDTNFNLCSDSDESEYQLTHTYTAGILATTKYRGLNYPSVDQTIDPGTGLVRSSRDTAGVETTYDYDVLRRLKSVTPAGREATKYCYTTPLATGPSCYNAASLLKPEPGSDVSVLITRGPAGDQGTQSMVVFDRWGRVRREYTLMPDGLASYRETTLDKLGRRTSVTELGRGDDLPKTLFEYDRFDRVTLITPPDHTTARESTTAFSYAGVWETNRTSFLTLPNGNQTVTTKEKYDAFGRLIEVTQNAGPTTVQASAGAAVLAKYGYDQGGRLRSVSMGLAGDTTPQEREFDYDGRGLLTREKHPESGETLYEYDSRSHLWKKNAAGTGFDLEYDYDSAERLLRTRALPSGDVIKQFEFGPDGHKRGRLIKATRMNYAPDGSGETIRVVEEYDYDLAGRLDERKTSIATAADLDAAGELLFQPITQSVAYDTLDRETAVTYPWCTSCGQPDADPENTGRLVTSTYQYGRVYSVDGFVGSTSYGENALWAERTHTNGVREVQVPETTTGMARPAQLLVYNIANCPVISLQPQNVQVNAAGTATLTVGSSVPGATFTWYEGVRGDTSKPVPNGSSSTLQVGPLTETKWYWCRVFSPDSACAEDSETAQVSVCVPPVITSPAADFAGEPVVVLKSASGTDPIEIRVIAGGTTLSYHWRVEHYENGLWISDDIVANAPSIPFSRSSVGTFRFFVSLTSGCGTAARLVTVIQVVDASEPAPVCTIPEIATGFPAQIRVTAGRPSVDLEVTLQPEAGAETWPADPNGFFFRWSVDGNPVHYGPKRWKFSADIPSAKTIKVEVSRICGELRSPQVTRQAFVWNVDNCPEPPMSVDQTSIALDDPDAKKEFTASSVWHTVTFEWYRGDSGNTRDLIHEGPAFASDEAGTYWVRAIGRCEMHTDGPTLTVTDGSCKPLELLRQPASANIHAGTPHVLSFETSQPAPDKIYWYEGLGTLNRLDAHLNSYGAAPIRTTTYWARAVRTGCHTADSMYATLHVTSCDDITVTEIPAGTTMTWDEFGSAHPLRVTANSPFPLAYQWYQGESGDTSVPVANADVPQIAVKPEETTKYWARISIAGGCAIDTAAVTVQVCHKPEIILQPTSRISVPGYGIWLAVDAKGTALSYQWYLGGEDDESHPILNANLSQYMATPSQTTQYWVRISDACAADGTHVDSEVVTISIAPSIVTQPLGGPAAKSSTRTLTVEAAGAALTYQWYLGPDDSQPIAGAIGASYTTPPLLADVTYWVRVYSGDAWVDSESAALTVCQPRGIVMNQPSTVSGSTVTLRVDFPDSNESYEWYTGESGDTTTLVNTATQISVTPAVTSKYWLRTNAGGCPADSPAWIVAVCFPNITVQPASVMVNPNATATLSVTASGDPALTYQWYEGTSGVTTTPIAGATAETFTTPALTATKSYWVAVSNQPSAYCNSTTVHSAAAAITICTPPNITSDPGSRTSTANAPVALTVAADGTERTYQWYAGTKGTTTNPISGATGTTLNVTPSMTSNYWVRVSGLCGSDDSETAKVSIPPVITAEPASASVTQGTTRTLSVSASGTELTYQWHDGASNPIPGATSSTYPTPAIHSNTSYWVRVSSGIAYTDSQIATLTVCLPRGVILSNPHKVAGALVTLQVDSPDTGETFEWYAGPSGTTTTPLGTGTSRSVAPNETTQYWVRTKRAGCDA
ncbi:MAG TPA: hypothetical protein VEK57_01780, partial [Thermoanaerobaculia bacterium]|nr:hypothetical protein [Thermoanaerobaculia bacterium]